MDHDFAPTSVEPWLHDLPAGTDAAGGGWRRWLQRVGLAPQDAWLDDRTPLLNRQGLFARSERVLAQHRNRTDGAALAVLEFPDLLEVRGIYGERISKALWAKLVEQLQRVAGRHGLAARTGPAQFAVLLPGLDRDGAVAALQAVLGAPCRIEFDARGCEIVLVPDVTVDVCAPGTATLPALYERLSVALARHRDHEERRRLHLRRSRERHSRGMPLEAGASQSAPASLPAA